MAETEGLEGQEDARTHVIKCKCLACSLHFTAYSFSGDWLPRFCPECGQHEGSFMVWRETSDNFIFMLVPGQAELAFMGGVPADMIERG